MVNMQPRYKCVFVWCGAVTKLREGEEFRIRRRLIDKTDVVVDEATEDDGAAFSKPWRIGE